MKLRKRGGAAMETPRVRHGADIFNLLDKGGKI